MKRPALGTGRCSRCVSSRRANVRRSSILLLAAILTGCSVRSAPPTADLPSAPAAADANPLAGDDQVPPGIFHPVTRGQTLYTIARTYGVTLSTLVQANEIEDPDRIEAGMLLFVPGAPETMEVPITVGPGARPAPGLRFLQPAAGPLNSGYGPRRGRMHYGVDIGAPAGSAVLAARDGTVLYAGSAYRGYGKLVILDHGDGYRTLYAHNRQLLVRAGRSVRRGDIIARVGSSGNATGPHLHFEIRKNDRPLDPAPYLR